MVGGGLRGLVGQGMGRRAGGGDLGVIGYFESVTPGVFAYESLGDGWALAACWGAGGTGQSSLGGNCPGGSGGGASFKPFRIRRGQIITGIIGQGAPANPGGDGWAGGDTSITLPDGRTFGATGGKGTSGTLPLGGGQGWGGDVNRRGGSGGAPSEGGESGEDGGALGGDGGSGNGGAGGVAGLASVLPFIVYPQASGGSPSILWGSGGRGSRTGTAPAGGHGRVLIFILKD